MSKIIVIYTSMTGNTEEMADAVAEGIREAGIEPEKQSVIDVNVDQLLEYDGIVLGAYTWGDGELPDDFLDFYDDMENIDLSGRKSAVFGSADSSYEHFGAAVDILLARLTERGAENVMEGFKVELTPSAQEIEKCKEFGREFVRLLQP